MKKLVFKTTINCEKCVQTVSPFLNQLESIDFWKVDTSNPQKVLTVSGDFADPNEIIRKVEEAGFNIQLLEQA